MVPHNIMRLLMIVVFVNNIDSSPFRICIFDTAIAW